MASPAVAARGTIIPFKDPSECIRRSMGGMNSLNLRATRNGLKVTGEDDDTYILIICYPGSSSRYVDNGTGVDIYCFVDSAIYTRQRLNPHRVVHDKCDFLEQYIAN